MLRRINKLLAFLFFFLGLQFVPNNVNAVMKLIDDNQDLYRPDRENYLKSLDYAKTLKSDSNDKLIFHCFWRVPRDFSIKHVTVLKSIIVSHQDHLDNLEINLWSNVDLSKNSLFRQVSDFVTLRKWNYSEEIKGTPLEHLAHINKDSLYDGLCYLESDAFRLLALHKYGGFYLDMDVLVLRDMSPLNNLEFLYQWATSGFDTDKPEMAMNNAIMRLNKGSDLSYEFLEKLAESHLAANSYNLGSILCSKVQKNDVLVLPGIWFDSEWGYEGTWGSEGGYCKPFTKDNFLLFDGAFAWHWHNRWDEPIEKGSKFDFLKTQIDQQFAALKRRLKGLG